MTDQPHGTPPPKQTEWKRKLEEFLSDECHCNECGFPFSDDTIESITHLLTTATMQNKAELVEKIEGMRKDIPFRRIPDTRPVYNQALSDVIDLINQK